MSTFERVHTELRSCPLSLTDLPVDVVKVEVVHAGKLGARVILEQLLVLVLLPVEDRQVGHPRLQLGGQLGLAQLGRVVDEGLDLEDVDLRRGRLAPGAAAVFRPAKCSFPALLVYRRGSVYLGTRDLNLACNREIGQETSFFECFVEIFSTFKTIST